MNLKRYTNISLIVSSAVLFIHFLFRLINQSKLLNTFPLDYVNDISSYLAQLFFLKTCGFLSACPYWYNGITTFESYSPGWFFFTFPLYLITNNVLISAYTSMILMFIIGFLLIYILGKNEGLTKIKIFALFILFFGNAIAIGNFIRLGRLTSLYGWISFLAIAVVIYFYKDKKLDRHFPLMFIPAYANLILSHPQELILTHFLIAGFFLIKDKKEKMMIMVYSAISAILTSFWWYPFISSTLQNTIEAGLWDSLKNQQLNLLASFALPIIFIFVTYIYLKSNRSKKEIIFYSPIILLSALMVLRLIPATPIIKEIPLDHYLLFFMFFSLLLFFKTDIEEYKFLNKLIPFLIIIISILSITINIANTPLFSEHGNLEKEIISFGDYIDGRLIIPGVIISSYPQAYYSYFAIYHNVSSASGWAETYASPDYVKRLVETSKSFKEKDCGKFLESIKNLSSDNILATGDDCKILEKCNLKLVKETKQVCLYKAFLGKSL